MSPSAAVGRPLPVVRRPSFDGRRTLDSKKWMDMDTDGYVYGWIRIRMDTDTDGWIWIRMDMDTNGYGYEWIWIRMDMDTDGYGYGWIWMDMDMDMCDSAVTCPKQA